MPDLDPLLTFSEHPHEQLLLDRMELPIGSINDGKLVQPDMGLELWQLLCLLHKKTVVHSELHCRFLEGEITLLMDLLSLL